MNDIGDVVSNALGASPPSDQMVVNINGVGSSTPKFDPSQSYGTPPKLLDNLMATESSGDPHAVNKDTGAMGAYQFMPGTVAQLSKQGVKFDPFNADQSRAAADYYIQQLHAKNGGDYNKTMAQYGGFVTKDPSAYVGKVMKGVASSAQSSNDSPSDFNANTVIDALNGRITQTAQPGSTFQLPPTSQQPPSQDQQPQPPTAPVDPSHAGVAQGQRIVALGSQLYQEAQANPARTIESNFAAVPEAALNMGSGLASSAIGGLAGLGRTGYGLLTGENFDTATGNAANLSAQIQNAGTYQPRTTGGKLVSEISSVPINAASEGLRAIGGDTGQFIGGAQGRIAGEEIGGAAPAVAGTIAGGMSMLSKPGTAPVGAVARGPVSLAERVEPTMGGVTPEMMGKPKNQSAPTLSEASPELQAAVESHKNAGTPINPAVLARHVEADTLDVPVSLTKGQATLDPQLISEEMNGRAKGSPLVSPDFYNQQGKALAANLDSIRGQVAPDILATHPTDLGQMQIDSYKNMDATSRADISAKYQAMKDSNGGNFPLNGTDFVNSADQALKADNVTRFLPPEIGGILNELRDGGPMNLNDFENYRTILAQQARKAARSGDGTAEHAINVVRNSLESIPMSEEAAAIKPLNDAARAAAKARFDRISADPAYKAAVNDTVEAGQPSPLADKFIPNFVTNGKSANIAKMKENLANDPQAAQVLAAATIDNLKSVSKADTETGKFNSDSYNKAVTQQSAKLGDLVGSEAAQKLQAVGRTAKLTSAQPAGSYVNNANSFVGAISDMGQKALRGITAAKTGGISEVARTAANAYKSGKAAKQSVAPGAGLTSLSDISP